MSLGIWPVFETKSPEIKFGSLGEILFSNIDALEAIALSAGITSLTAFMDCRAVPDGFDGDPDELSELLGPWMDWYESAQGVLAVDGLLAQIASNPMASKELDEVEWVKTELDELARTLLTAQTIGTRFRLEVF